MTAPRIGARRYRRGHRVAVISVPAPAYSKAIKLRDALGLATLDDLVELVTRDAVRAAGNGAEG